MISFTSKKLFGYEFVYRDGCPEGDRYTETYESRMQSRFRKHIGRGGAFLDVGGNYGYYSLLTRVLNQRVPIFYFDPNPFNYECFRETVRRNDMQGVVPYCCAIGGGFSMLNFSGESWYTNAQLRTYGAGQPVLAVSLDSTPGAQTRVGVIKMDVEGMEWEVLHGATRILATRPVLFVEFCPEVMAEHGVVPQTLLRFLADCGYGIEHCYLEDVSDDQTVYTDPDLCMKSFLAKNTWMSNLCCTPL